MASRQVPTVAVLKTARGIVANKETWTEGAYARDAAGRGALYHDPAAVRWCAVGAILRATELHGLDINDSDPLRDALGRIALRKYNRGSIVTVNDQEGRKAVLSVFDAAIAELRARHAG
jgi:hypothetical protein